MNQDQRELLELAAYAIGWKAEKWIDAHEGADGVQYSEYYATRRDDGVLVAFNPLTNKDDAFDLMVKLHLNVESVYAGARCGTADKTIEVVNQDTTDHESAYMLAITRAAAAIGKQMKERNGNAE